MIKKTLLFSLLLSASVLGVNSQNLNIGNYDDIEVYGSYDDFESYDGSSWVISPINFYYKHTGTQIILKKDQISDLAGKNINSLSLKYYIEGYYGSTNLTDLKIYLSETNRDVFYKNDETGRYRAFDVSRATQVFSGSFDIDEYQEYIWYEATGECTIDFDTPFYYNGDNNLVVTFVADTEEQTSGAFYVNFFVAEGYDNQAMGYSSDRDNLWEDILAGDLYFPKYSVSTVSAPVFQLSYEDGIAPEATWTSYIPTQDEDLNLVGFDAYILIGTANGKAQLERVSTAKAGEPLIVKNSIKPSISLATSATKRADNLLRVSDGTVAGDGETIYALGKKEGVVGFYLVKEGSAVPANKVYLQTEESAGATPFISFDAEGTTGIEDVKTATSPVKADNSYYTLSGVRVAHPTKGVYIHQGKKVVFK